ncbi:MAG: isoprenyl transferase [Gammaproteobacteria bacterium]|jgi:undecaprenyl diphosphate synthase|nr:isoprenyl transferase [Gammaproteobacteria bacterium]
MALFRKSSDRSAPALPASGGLPAHVAVIMDGNGRWARQRHLPRIAGHRAGVEAVRCIVRACQRKGIAALTLFAFSSENWRRPEREVTLLLELLMTAIRREVESLREANVRLRFIGDRSAFGDTLGGAMEQAEARTAECTGLALTVAINYGGRWDMTQAARELARMVEQGRLTADQVDERTFASLLDLRDVPEPDLFIRTGGEQRISNFLLWQLAYTELYFTDILWPDFDERAFEDALGSFAGRQRRFGRTGEQIEQVQGA